MISSHRRRILGAAAALTLVQGKIARAQNLPLTPACGKQTPSQTAGPFFKPNSPERASLLEKSANAPRLVLTGVVLSRDCKPVANALLDFWHADEEGDYDNKGFRYRGHQHADAQGRWRLETILPAEYPGRTRHIHVNVQAPGKRILTTQLYFPGERDNARDGLYRKDLEIRDFKKGDALAGGFDFVVDV
jgi:protocatechuate 3,4-dioxygenase beta subunit